jgi:hypothetical protein
MYYFKFATLDEYESIITRKSMIFQAFIATTFRGRITAPKNQELIPLVFPLKKKGESPYVMAINRFTPPLIYKEAGRGFFFPIFVTLYFS